MSNRQKKIPSPWGSISPQVYRSGLVRYRLRGQIEGETVSVGHYDTIEEAQAAAAGMREATANLPAIKTLERWGAEWFEQLAADGKKTDTKLQHWKASIAGTWIVERPLKKLTPRDVRRWLRETSNRKARSGKRIGQRVRRDTVRNALTTLSSCLNAAVEADHIPVNPARGISVPSEPRSDDTWTYLQKDEIRTVVQGELRDGTPLPLFQHTVFTFAIYSGLRAGEIWGLRWADVDLSNRVVTVRFNRRGPTKNGKIREVPLLPPAHRALSLWKSERPGLGGALVFPKRVRKGEVAGEPFGEGYNAGWMDRVDYRRPAGERELVQLPGWSTKLGISRYVRFHDLRHTCASHLVMGTWGRPWRLDEVREVLGHSSIKVTERYAHLAPDALRGANQAAWAHWTGD